MKKIIIMKSSNRVELNRVELNRVDLNRVNYRKGVTKIVVIEYDINNGFGNRNINDITCLYSLFFFI